MLGFSTRGEVQEHIATVNAQNAEDRSTVVLSTPMGERVGADADLKRFATAGGGAVFRTYCAQCHGAGAQGAKGYPNLQDDDWLWGGDLAALETTIRHGIRHDADEDTRYSEMPKFGEFLEESDIASLTEYVLQISGQDYDEAKVGDAKTLFVDNCCCLSW